MLVDRPIDAGAGSVCASRGQRREAGNVGQLRPRPPGRSLRGDEPTCGDRFDHPSHWDRRAWDVRYDFTIRVPKNTRLDLCTINDGNIVVSGTRADFSIHTINGRITMDDVGGSGEATTINGRVHRDIRQPHPARPRLFKTINGDVVLEMPERLAADLRMKTVNGGLFTDFEVEPLPAAHATSRCGGRTASSSTARAPSRRCAPAAAAPS